ncbi:hypothetical protein GCM10020219_061760 [Nonomuraea dietziae]
MIACLSLVLLLSSCGGDHEASPGGSHGASRDEFETRAREVAERWQGSADDHAWRKGFVALEVLNPQGWNHVSQSPALGEQKLAQRCLEAGRQAACELPAPRRRAMAGRRGLAGAAHLGG